MINFIKTEWLSILYRRLIESDVGYRMAIGASWSLIGGLGTKLITMASAIIIARLRPLHNLPKIVSEG